MPALTGAELDTYRTGGPIAMRYYLAVEPMNVVMKASLNNASATWNDRTIPYDNITQGAEANVAAGHTLEVWDSTETTYRGKVRIRSIDTTEDEITVAANDDIQWTNNDVLIVRDTYEPWPRPTNMVDQGQGGGIIYYKDWDVTYTDNSTSFPPKANGGVEFAGYLNDSGYVDVVFPGADLSLPIAPSATISTYSWDIGDGAFQVGDASTGNITARFSQVGFRWVHLTVTDSNGKTGIHHIPVWTFGDGYEPVKNVEIRRRTYGVGEAELHIECFETALTESDIAEGARVVLFSQEYIGSTLNTSDCGAPFEGRRQVRFNGWILRDTVRWDPERGMVAFSVGNIGKVAKELTGYGTFLADVTAAATNWHEANNLTARMIIHFVLHWHSTLPTICCIEYFDYNATDGSPLIAGRKFGASSPIKQIEEAMLIERGLFVYAGTSRWSSIHFRYDPQGLGDTDRAARPTVCQLTNPDLFREMRFERSARPLVNSVLGGGVVYNGTDGLPLRARAPGRVGMLQSSRRQRVENLIISSQVHLNAVLGRYLGKASDPWDAVPLEAMWDVFEPALQEYITLDVPASSNPRGWAFTTAQRWLVRRVDIRDATLGAPEVRLEVERLTEPTNAVTVQIPAVPDFPWPDYPAPLPLPGPEEPTILGERLLVATDGGLFMTGDLSSSYPIWETTGTGELDGLNIIDFAFDTDNNRRVVAIEADAGYGSTSFGNVWMTSDYRSSPWVKVLDGVAVDAAVTSAESGSPCQGGFVQAHGMDGRAVLVAQYTEGIVHNLARTFTGGANWSTSLQMSGRWTNPALGWPDDRRFYINIDVGFFLNQSGTVTFVGMARSYPNNDVRMTSGDYGQTWTIQESGPNRPSGVVIRGGLNIEGTYIIWCTYSSGISGVVSLEEWAGGLMTARTVIEDWQSVDVNGILMGYRRQCVYGADISYLYCRSTDSSDPLGDGRYGWTYWYKNGGWPITWEAVQIPIYCRAADSFWGDPENMIAMGNSHPYVTGAGEYLVMLLSGEGTSISNKSGTGATGLYGLGANYVNRVLFDQWED